MNIFPIRTEADYEKALARIEMLMDAEFNTPEGDELDILTTLVENYEAKHFVIPAHKKGTGYFLHSPLLNIIPILGNMRYTSSHESHYKTDIT